MKEIKISDESLYSWEEDLNNGVIQDKLYFDTDEEIEVRLPFEGYYSIKIKCNDPQIAMIEALRADKIWGLLH